jgi:hypothetical protein
MIWKFVDRDCLQKCAKFAVQRNLLNCLSAKARPGTNEEKIDLFLSLFVGKCQSRVLSHFDLAELLCCLLASGGRHRKTPDLCLPIIFTISARF